MKKILLTGGLIIICLSLIWTALRQTPSSLNDKQLIPVILPHRIPPTNRSIQPFLSISAGMSMKQVIALCGLPDHDIGSGIYIYVYILADQSRILIGSPDQKQILYVVHWLKNGEQHDLFRNGSAAIAPNVTSSSLDPTQCVAFLEQWGDKPKELKFSSCQLESTMQGDKLVTRYMTNGKNAVLVETFLRRRFQMGKLHFMCCYWGTPDQLGIYKDKDDYSYDIEMVSEETGERDWHKIDQFEVRITKYLFEP